MNRDGLVYEPPKAKIFRFDDNDRILTESGIPNSDFAANALNIYFGGTNTTKE